LVKRREPNRWSVKSNPTLARNREPDRRYAISSPTSAEERKLDRRFAYANPTLVQRRQADADLQPTITTSPCRLGSNRQIHSEYFFFTFIRKVP
jgi:hypothetical protein